MTRTLLILVLAAAALSAQRKPITLDAYEQWRARPARNPGAPVWSPTGTYFAYREGGELKIYDVASHAARTLVRLDELNASVEPPPPNDRDPWENRRVFTKEISWSPARKSNPV